MAAITEKEELLNETYRQILISPIRKCADYTPKFGHKQNQSFSLSEFQELYGSDSFYRWLGLDNPLMYSAHKAAGALTSIYRQIGIGCERLVRQIFMDYLHLNDTDVKWSYAVKGKNGKDRILSLDGRIVFESVKDNPCKERLVQWKNAAADQLQLSGDVGKAMNGVVFEVRQGYKSKDSKRQNADIANASNALANGYIPCLMLMSSQIDDDIVTRYEQAKWFILQGYENINPLSSTYDFFKEIIGFDFADFMVKNQSYFQSEINTILENLLRAE